MDRSLPEKVALSRVEKPIYLPPDEEEEEEGVKKRERRGDLRRFDEVKVREVRMGKMHTGEWAWNENSFWWK